MNVHTTVDAAAARRAIDAKTKPLGALGQLEEMAVRLAVLQNTLTPALERTRVCVFAADHGISAEGVSAYPREVTAEMMKNFDRGGAAINVIARANGVGVEVIDVGVDADLTALASVRAEKVCAGSRNFATGAAMSDLELSAALAVGAEAARRAAADGVQALGLGEMGIANTTSAAALLSALTGHAPGATVGLGTGVSETALRHKRATVERALAFHQLSTAGNDPRECLRRLGGLEIAAIAGAALEAARCHIAVVADGFISTVAVLAAIAIAKATDPAALAALDAALVSAHRSAEAGHRLALDACSALLDRDLRPILDLEMRLGEGTGAALAMPVLRSAAAVMREMATFASAGVSAGEHERAHNG